MMTIEERQAAFVAALKTAEERYGVTVMSQVQARMEDGRVIVEPGPVKVVVLSNWKGKENKDEQAN